MYLGDAHIMMSYGRPENVNLAHSIKFITQRYNIFKVYSQRTPRR